MKKLILAVGCICLLSACVQKRPELTDNSGVAESINVIPTQIMIVEGCEYISLPGKYGFSHKGNCKNPIHGKGYLYQSKIITCPKCGEEIVESGEKCR